MTLGARRAEAQRGGEGAHRSPRGALGCPATVPRSPHRPATPSGVHILQRRDTPRRFALPPVPAAPGSAIHTGNPFRAASHPLSTRPYPLKSADTRSRRRPIIPVPPRTSSGRPRTIYPHGKSVPRAAAPVPPRLPSAPRAGKSPDGGGKHLITREILYSRATSSPSRGPLLPAPGPPGPTPLRFTMHQNRPSQPRKILVHSSADENLRARSLAAGAKNHHRHPT